jgi:hypothetical protein
MIYAYLSNKPGGLNKREAPGRVTHFDFITSTDTFFEDGPNEVPSKSQIWISSLIKGAALLKIIFFSKFSYLYFGFG